MRLAAGVWIALLYAVAGVVAEPAQAIEIVIDYTLDEQNENWFNPLSTVGQDRRAAVEAAAAFLSTIIVNDDWEPLPTLNESFSVSDIAASTIRDLDGNLLFGSPESDGEGYAYSSSGNNIDTTNRSSVGANEYIVYVGAFAFDSGTTANAKGGWDSNDRRNDAGHAGVEFNTWGGKFYFNTNKTWYVGSNPGVDPTEDYGIQDEDKSPAFDISSDNWMWSTSSQSWKGFDLRTIDPASEGTRDLYATTIHELMHTLGATTSGIEDYVGVNSSGDFIGANILQTYGGPAPGAGGHFEEDTQSTVWGSDGILSETTLDPNSRSHVRKYFTDLDAALLRDLGYNVLEQFPVQTLAGDFNSDGSVDAIDYAVWREGYPTEYDQQDFLDWRNNYGTLISTGPVSTPEPGAMALVVLLMAVKLGSVRSTAVGHRAMSR